MADVTLTTAEAQSLRDMAARIRDVRAMLARAKRAGIDVSVLESEVAHLEQVRTGVLREFAPRLSTTR